MKRAITRLYHRKQEILYRQSLLATQAEAALESQAAAPASDDEATVQRLVQQRDTAAAALDVRTVQMGPVLDACEAKVVHHWETG